MACLVRARMWGSRMRILLALTVALGAALPAQAETLMTPEEFESWSTNRTLDYFDGGVYWGSEQHLPGRRTLDSDVEGSCRKGVWFPQGDAICFEYETVDGTHCWFFWRDGNEVTTRTVEAGPEVSPYAVQASDIPLNCPGPDVGV